MHLNQLADELSDSLKNTLTQHYSDIAAHCHVIVWQHLQESAQQQINSILSASPPTGEPEVSTNANDFLRNRTADPADPIEIIRDSPSEEMEGSFVTSEYAADSEDQYRETQSQCADTD